MRAVRLRRPDDEMRIEIMPLIDVIFLLLTFFIYAMVLMVRIDVLPLDMQTFVSGARGVPAPAVTISIDAAGTLHLDRDPIAIHDVLLRLEMKRAEAPDTIVYIAADRTGDLDRLPTFLELYDRLATAGFDIRLVGAPPE